MPYEPTFKRRVSVTLLRAGTSVVAFDLALVLAGALHDYLAWIDPMGLAYALSMTWQWATLVPLGWAVLGGAVLDHRLARRGPWWPLLVHPVGLFFVSGATALVVGVIGIVKDGTPYGLLGIVLVMPVPFLGITSALAMWMIPESFPAYVPSAPVYSSFPPPGSSSEIDGGPSPHPGNQASENDALSWPASESPHRRR